MRPVLTAANRFTGVALIFGIAFIIITPPFQAPDEVAHFYRIYQMSEGRLKPENFLLGIGGDLPTTVRKVSREMFDNVRFHPENKIDISLFMKTLNTKINPEDRAVTFFANTAHYPPLVYLPQTLGVVLARLFSLNMFAIFYAGRLLNLLVYIYLMRAAINLTPSGKEVFGLIGLMPMAIFQAASLSSDMMTNAVGVLFVGYILNGYDKSDTYSLKWLTGLWFMVMLLLFVKPGYYPLLILVFTLPFYNT